MLILKDREISDRVIYTGSLCQTGKSQSWETTVQQKCLERNINFDCRYLGEQKYRQCFH